MYTREQRKALIRQFWNEFDTYCEQFPELAWRRKKWLLHRTGISGVDLKFEPGRKGVMVMIEINHRDEDERLEMYKRLETYKPVIEQQLEGELSWDFAYRRDSGQEVCRIYTFKSGLDIHRQSDWSAMHQFMAEKMDILQNNLMEIKELLEEA